MLKPIEIAKKELGYKETGKNITKYSADFDTKWPTYFNTKKQGAEWCSILYNWLFVKAYGEKLAKQMLFEPDKGNCAAGCKYAAQYYKNKNRFDKNPRVGDQIFFYVGGDINHTGIVIDVDVNRNNITTIEGNSSNMVQQKNYSLRNSSIAGYGHPDFSLVNDDNNDTKETTCMIELPVLRLGSKGDAVKSLQILLNGYNFIGKNGKKLTVDGDFGANTEYAVRNFQKSAGLTPDGICGLKTWPALIK